MTDLRRVLLGICVFTTSACIEDTMTSATSAFDGMFIPGGPCQVRIMQEVHTRGQSAAVANARIANEC